MRVVCHGKGYARFAVNAQKSLRRLFFYLKTVVLYLEIKTVLTEKRGKLKSLALCLLIISGAEHTGYRTGNAAAQTHKPLGVFMQKLPIYPRLDIKALGERRRNKVAEIFIAGLVFAQQNEVGVLGVYVMLLVKACARCDINLAADDGLYPLGKAGLVKRHRAVHNTVVGYRNGGLTQLLCAFCKPPDAARAVEQRKFRMNM